ncbi:hypothetical protein H6G89_05670 [Oscillatoria sp. FACHB-1407]|uniref:hypothetical protein n=1 Tax=Oscillatoria sp. FACHB-1407 TaxID=2692847 RepID=UPI001686B987|nr:hypothetical protein [Oscillatoria sp. FACHB-1407]MBD2460529.1 hypothetical protein [Oscillatoria sp. FACHB-1407]
MNRIRIALLIIYVLLFILLRSIKMLIWAKTIGKDIYINAWYGELGNNLIQIVHAEYLSQKTGLTIHLPKHRYLNLEQSYRIHTISPSVPQDVDPGTTGLFLADLRSHPGEVSLRRELFRSFFYKYDISPFKPSLTEYRTLFQTKALPLISSRASQRVTDETLVIHMRSGDVFQKKPHPAYVQPPVSFYLKIIEEFNFTDILIVTQNDFRNPCIEHLKQLIPTVRVQASTLEDDISAILSARNLVTAFSTFSIALAFASTQIKQLYIPQLQVKKDYWRTLFWSPIFKLAFQSNDYNNQFESLDFTLYPIKIHNYVAIGDWKNNQAQRDLMIHHSREHLSF